MVRIDGQTDKRSYSIVESSQDGARIVHKRAEGPGCPGAARSSCTPCSPGTQLEITQPLQNFPLRSAPDSYILLAGGIGITAMPTWPRCCKTCKADYTLVYAGRSRDRDGLSGRAAQLHGDRLVVHVDDEGTLAAR